MKQSVTIHNPTTLPDVVDETLLATGEAARLYRWLKDELLRDGPTVLTQLQRQGQQWMKDLGVTFSLHQKVADPDHVVTFDPFPRVIGQEEWTQLQKGVTQRLAIWNAFLKDIHGTQEILRAGIVPYHWVYDDPNYHRGAVEVTVPEEIYAHVAAFDLVRQTDGGWVVFRDMLSYTTGAIYAVQARNALQQIAPALLEGARLWDVDDYPTRLLEHLRRFAPTSAPEPRVALFSPGDSNYAYYEHSSLARQMGVPLLQGGDLTVLNSRLYFKTVGGLEPVDVLYRRLDEAQMDPLEFGGGSQIGVAGLMNCVRKGTVAVVNALGAGLGDNRAIASLMPQLARFYLNEPLLLPTCERFPLEDADQRAHVKQHLQDFIIAPLYSRSPTQGWACDQLSEEELDALWARVIEAPGTFVAEPRLPFNLLPTVTSDGLGMRHAGLRVFARGGEPDGVSPCALTRFARQKNSRAISSGLDGGIKDTWVLQSADETDGERPIIIRSGQRRSRLGSRSADSLYWIGRYSERAETITRVLQVVQTEFLSRHSSETSADRRPLLEAMARLGGHRERFYLNARLPRGLMLEQHVLLSSNNASSVSQCVELCRVNARRIRENIPPEIWMVINRLVRLFEGAEQRNEAGGGGLELRQAVALEESLLNQFDALTGAVQKNMVHGDSRHFWNLGVQLERMIDTIAVLRPVLIRRPDPRTGELRRNEDHLDALLGMLASRYAYRSLYQSRPTPEYVARLLLQDELVPRSVLRCLRELRVSLDAVTAGSPSSGTDGVGAPVRLCGQLLGRVEYTDLKQFFAPVNGHKPPRLHRWLDELTASLAELSGMIGDHYLHHQAFNILR